MLALVGTIGIALLIAGLIWRFSGTSKAKSKSTKTSNKKAQKQSTAPAKPSKAAAEAPGDDSWMQENSSAATRDKAAAKGGAAKKAKGKAAQADRPRVEAAPGNDEPETAPEPAGEELAADAVDGSGWETATALPKKVQRKRERQAAEQAQAAQAAQAAKAKPQRLIPGMAPEEEKPKAGSVTAAAGSAAVSLAVPGAAGLKLSASQEKEAAEKGASQTAVVKVPEKMIGRVIGPKGATLKLIQEKTGVGRIDTSGEVFTILGPPKAVALAEMAIKELCDKGFTSLQFEDFSQTFVNVHPSMFAEIIGKQGAVIRKIKEELNVEVTIPEVPRDAVTQTKKYKVTLAGSSASVQKAKEVLTDILQVYHHELTHPGLVHEEIEVEPWQLNFIIGKRGSEIKHIQGNFRVRVYIANQHSINQATVIVGEPRNVERAKAYIEKILWNAENAPRGREAQTGAYDGDAWGEEEEHEEWMDGYIYKRR